MAELQQQRPKEGFKAMLPEKGPTTAQVVAVVTLFPIGGILLTLSGITLTGTVIGLAVATPLFILFSPVLVPAAIVVVLAVGGFLTSGAFGLTALTSLSWTVNYLRGKGGAAEQAKRRLQEGQKAKDVGQSVQSKAGQEGARST